MLWGALKPRLAARNPASGSLLVFAAHARVLVVVNARANVGGAVQREILQ